MDTGPAASRRFVARAVRRKPLFLALSFAGVAIGLGLAVWIGWRRWHDPSFPLGTRVVVVVLVLLNARQNLRQYRYATALEELGGGPERDQKTLV